MPASKSLLYSILPCYLNTLSFGFVIGFTSPMLSKMSAVGEPYYKNEKSFAWFTSIATIGAMLGSFLAGNLVDKLGRKRSIFLTAFPYLIGWLFISLGKETAHLAYGRLLTGVGIGMTCVVSPMFISEISNKELRGLLGSCFQLCVTIGIILAYGLGMLFEWRSFAFMLVIFPVLTLVISLYILESPRYLLEKGLRQEAYRSLLLLRDTSSSAEEELTSMELTSKSSSSEASMKDMMEPSAMQPLKVALMCMLLQQFTGINVVLFYTAPIFETAGFDKSQSDMAALLIAFIQFIFTIVATVLMDKAGRKFLLLLAGLGMSVSCAFIGQFLGADSTNSDVSTTTSGAASSSSLTIVVSLIAYIAFFSLGWGPVPLVLASEIFPSKVKGKALGISVFFSWFTAFAVTLYFPVVKDMLGMSGVFFFFALCCCFSSVYVYSKVPETKGKSLDEISTFFTPTRLVRGV